jgi:hypothetical protein
MLPPRPAAVVDLGQEEAARLDPMEAKRDE